MHLRDGFLADQLDPIYVAYNMQIINIYAKDLTVELTKTDNTVEESSGELADE